MENGKSQSQMDEIILICIKLRLSPHDVRGEALGRYRYRKQAMQHCMRMAELQIRKINVISPKVKEEKVEISV